MNKLPNQLTYENQFSNLIENGLSENSAQYIQIFAKHPEELVNIITPKYCVTQIDMIDNCIGHVDVKPFLTDKYSNDVWEHLFGICYGASIPNAEMMKYMDEYFDQMNITDDEFRQLAKTVVETVATKW